MIVANTEHQSNYQNLLDENGKTLKCFSISAVILISSRDHFILTVFVRTS